MSTKRIIGSIVASFILLAAGRFLIHAVWLANAYAQAAVVFRPQTAMLHRVWILYVADLSFAVAGVLIYVRGIEAKPWLGQGIRFGILLALVSAVPQSLMEYVVYPVPHIMAWEWIAGEGVLAVLVGIVIAVICKPTD